MCALWVAGCILNCSRCYFVFVFFPPPSPRKMMDIILMVIIIVRFRKLGLSQDGAIVS